MPVRGTCPECQATYELPDHPGDQPIVCERCRCRFDADAALAVVEVIDEPPGAVENAIQDSPGRVVEARETAAPRARRGGRRHLSEEGRPRPPTRTRLVVAVVVGAVLLLVCGVAGFGWLIVRARLGGSNSWSAAASFRRGTALLEQGRYPEAERELREAVRLNPGHALAHNNLGWALIRQDRNEEAEAEFREAIRLDPKSGMAHSNLSHSLSNLGRYPEAEAAAREAVRVQPGLAIAHSNLGMALQKQGRLNDAEAAFRKASQLDPRDATVKTNLGNCLSEQGRQAEAEPLCREAIRLAPDLAAAHTNLGHVLYLRGQLVEGETETRESVRLRPASAIAHSNLGMILSEQGRCDEAEAECREAIRLQPGMALAHNNLGIALHGRGQPKEAEAALREAIRLQPRLAVAHSNLGLVLATLGRFKEAEAECREALRLRPEMATAHNNFGIAMLRQSRFREAEAAFREAVRHQPGYALAMCNLGIALRDQGRLDEALEQLRKGHELGQRVTGWGWPSANWVRECERLLTLDQKLVAILAGGGQPADRAERAELVRFCLDRKRLPAAAARLAAEPCADEAQPDDDEPEILPYEGARAAALAAAGQGADALRLPDKVRVMMRRQAYRWLRAGLTRAADDMEHGNGPARDAARRRLISWQQDRAFASVRSTRALKAVPDDERQLWQALWTEVESLNRKAVPAK
jgi:Flp pilus assembly protein TadD